MQIEKVTKIAADVYSCDPKERSRKRKVVWSRTAVFVYMREENSLSIIGGVFKMDHATVLHSISRHKNLYGSDKLYTTLHNRFRKIVGMPITATTEIEIEEADNAVDNRLVQLAQTVPAELVENVYIKLDAIIKMTVAVHKRQMSL